MGRFAKIVDALHAKGTPVFLQLWHCGRASHSSFHDGQPAVSASAVQLHGEYIHTPEGKLPYETPRALEIPEVRAVVEDYRQAAARAKAAGFDGTGAFSPESYDAAALIMLAMQAAGSNSSNRRRTIGQISTAEALRIGFASFGRLWMPS